MLFMDGSKYKAMSAVIFGVFTTTAEEKLKATKSNRVLPAKEAEFLGRFGEWLAEAKDIIEKEIKDISDPDIGFSKHKNNPIAGRELR